MRSVPVAAIKEIEWPVSIADIVKNDMARLFYAVHSKITTIELNKEQEADDQQEIAIQEAAVGVSKHFTGYR